MCSVPGCGASADGGFTPDFPFRILHAVAARGPSGLEAYFGGGRVTPMDSPDPEWVCDDDRSLYWRMEGGVLPAGSPLCPLHRTVWNLKKGEIARLGPARASEWEARHEEAAPQQQQWVT